MNNLQQYNDYMDTITVDEHLHNKIINATENASPRLRLRVNSMYALAASLCLIIGLSAFVVFGLGGNDVNNIGAGSVDVSSDKTAFLEFVALLKENGFEVEVYTRDEEADIPSELPEFFPYSNNNSVQIKDESKELGFRDISFHEFDTDEAAQEFSTYIDARTGSSISGPNIGVEISWGARPHWFLKDNLILFYGADFEFEEDSELNVEIIRFLKTYYGELFAGCNGKCKGCKAAAGQVEEPTDEPTETTISTAKPSNTQAPQSTANPTTTDNFTDEPTTVDSYHLDIEVRNAFATGVQVRFVNRHDAEMLVCLNYTLEGRINGHWGKIPILDNSTDEPTLIVNPNSKTSWMPINWEHKYGTLSSGKYTIWFFNISYIHPILGEEMFGSGGNFTLEIADELPKLVITNVTRNGLTYRFDNRQSDTEFYYYHHVIWYMVRIQERRNGKWEYIGGEWKHPDTGTNEFIDNTPYYIVINRRSQTQKFTVDWGTGWGAFGSLPAGEYRLEKTIYRAGGGIDNRHFIRQKFTIS
jgi:hypothetical protein